jgi:alpha-beta hydrolase superfamily lysophospholipase
VIGFDYKGFGLSEGTRGLIDSYDSTVTDGVSFIKKSKEYY